MFSCNFSEQSGQQTHFFSSCICTSGDLGSCQMNKVLKMRDTGSLSPSAPQGFLGNGLFFCELLIIQLFAWTHFGFWIVPRVPNSRYGVAVSLVAVLCRGDTLLWMRDPQNVPWSHPAPPSPSNHSRTRGNNCSADRPFPSLKQI